MPIILSSYQHCDEQQFQTPSCALYTIFPVTKLDVVIQALLLDYILVLERKYAYSLRASCFYIEINIFEYFKTKYTTKSTSVSQCSPGNMPGQPCSKRADTILYYYFHIKEEHFKMF